MINSNLNHISHCLATVHSLQTDDRLTNRRRTTIMTTASPLFKYGRLKTNKRVYKATEMNWTELKQFNCVARTVQNWKFSSIYFSLFRDVNDFSSVHFCRFAVKGKPNYRSVCCTGDIQSQWTTLRRRIPVSTCRRRVIHPRIFRLQQDLLRSTERHATRHTRLCRWLMMASLGFHRRVGPTTRHPRRLNRSRGSSPHRPALPGL